MSLLQGVPQKITPCFVNFELGIKVGGVLESSGSQLFKTVPVKAEIFEVEDTMGQC